MKERWETARSIRIGSERLRQIAAEETNAKLAADMLETAAEMDQHAAEIERSLAKASVWPFPATASRSS
ncbi:MAG TPA: hypothetical protein VN728_10220 [Stellaceae bacterium]|nr:hypothetical protein [Stellaceae bacterium]